MVGIILGILFIIGGVILGGLSFFAAGMADRAVTAWEGLWTPLIFFLVPVAIGVALIVCH